MVSRDKEMGMVLQALKHMERDLHEVKEDVKSLLGTRNRTYGMVAAIGFVAGNFGSFFLKLLGVA